MPDPFAPPEASPDSAIVAYTVHLRAPGARPGSWSTSGSYPVPRFHPRCVCCGVETTHTKDYDPGDSNQLTETFEIPVCPACIHHVAGGRFWDGMLALAGGLGLATIVLGGLGWALLDAGPYAVVFGVIAASVSAVGYGLRHWLAVSSSRRGHHTMFESWVAPGFTAIRTTNRQLVDDLLELHGPMASLDREVRR